MMAPTMVSWAAHLGRLNLAGSWLNFFSSVWARGIFTLLAIVELVTDQLPTTPSRTVPVQFGARLVSGGLSGAAIGAAKATVVGGLVFRLFGLFPNLAAVAISLRDVVAALLGSLVVLAVLWLWQRTRRPGL